MLHKDSLFIKLFLVKIAFCKVSHMKILTLRGILDFQMCLFSLSSYFLNISLYIENKPCLFHFQINHLDWSLGLYLKFWTSYYKGLWVVFACLVESNRNVANWNMDIKSFSVVESNTNVGKLWTPWVTTFSACLLIYAGILHRGKL